jgi:pre-mRNA branch site protein p14
VICITIEIFLSEKVACGLCRSVKKFIGEMSREIQIRKTANRILYVRNLPVSIDGHDLYDLFGRYGPIRQIRLGNTPKTVTTAYVVYEDVFDAQSAKDNLNGYTMGSRYLIVQYHKLEKIVAPSS